MNIFIKNTIVLAILSTCCYGLVDIEKYLKVCDRNSAEVNDCLTEAVQEGLAALADGIEEIGVPPIDPYRQKDLRIEYKNNQILAKLVAKDIYVEGLKTATVHDARLRADDDRFHLELDLTTPRVNIRGQYLGEGRYNSLQIKAHGHFSTNMTNLVYTWKLDGVPEKNENGTFVRITDFYMRPDVGSMKSHLTNDNPDSRDLTELGNRFTNQNWRLLYRELLPYAQANWNKIGISVANKIFLKITYDQLFPSKS
uniref:Odorant-binding protein 4 n=1 Tax=Cnaphalocrocis medinalis TaxID=437488 RepID=A0A0U3BFB9_CNAME|nr:odorant-binding protein 4 [Cnaphalocrocis medinalis]